MISILDKKLIQELASSGVEFHLIAEKFEIRIFDIIKIVYGCDFPIKAHLVDRNLKRGSMMVSELGLEKRCSRCSQFFPLFKEFWHSFNMRNQVMISPHCKACELERKKKQRE